MFLHSFIFVSLSLACVRHNLKPSFGTTSCACMAVLMKENYGKWCILFGSQDPWEIVNNGYADPMAEEEDRYALEKKNAPNDQ